MAVKKSSQKIDDALGKSVNFELTVADIAKRSERRAWWVAITAIVMALILLGGYFYMLPLKEKVPYVIMADAYTGTSSLARLTDDFTNRHISANEAITRSNVAHFVLARESFDAAMSLHDDWMTVLSMSMSAQSVSGPYRALMSPQNQDGLYKAYNKNQALRIKILSIVLVGGGPNQAPKGATVRFQRNVYNKLSGSSQPLDGKIATMTFTYKPDLQMDEEARIENPLGFQVLEYRVDNDYDSSAPAEVPGSPIQQPTAAGTAPSDPTQPLPPQNTSATPGATAVPTSANTDNGVGRR